MANFVCFVAARASMAGWDVRKEGLARRGEGLLAYASTETHTWIQKAADLFGLGTGALKLIPTDDRQRMDPPRSARQIDRSRAVVCIRSWWLPLRARSAPAPSILSPKSRAICREHGLWFHVDGAYGGLAAQVPGAPPGLSGLTLADSVAVDPHKWMYAPLEAGCALVRDAAKLRNAFSYHPPYYHFDDEVDELLRLRPAEFTRVPGAEGVAGTPAGRSRPAI